MTDTQDNDPLISLASKLEQDLFARYGPMLGGKDLQAALGYRSGDAFRQAVSRNTIPVPIFSIDNRRGKFALVMDVATWLAKQRLKTGVSCE